MHEHDVCPLGSIDELVPRTVIVEAAAAARRYFRVLWRDPDPFDNSLWWNDRVPRIVVIEILNSAAWPMALPIADARDWIGKGTWQKFCGHDPYPFVKYSSDTHKSEKFARHEEHKAALSRLVHSIADQRPAAFLPATRIQLSKDAAIRFKVSDSLIRKWLRNFWQSGESEDALWPRHCFSGAPTIEEVLQANESLPVCRGRRPADHTIESERHLPGEVDWRKPSRKQRELMEKGFKEYLEHSKDRQLLESGNGIPWQDMLRFVVDTYFASQTHLSHDRRGRPESVTIKNREEMLPTVDQFRAFILSKHSTESIVAKLRSARQFQLNDRIKAGDTRVVAYGPGVVVVADWTLADIFLVNRFSRLPCGRPYVYCFVDFFSRMILGIYVTFEKPSLAVAKKAIRVALSDKKPHAKQYGVPLEDHEWRGPHGWWRLQTDNGELAAVAGDLIVLNKVSDMSTTPPFRADLNFPGENAFRCMNMRVRFLRGHTRGPRERCAPDPALQSNLDIVQFTGLMIDWVARVACTREIEEFARTPLMARHPVAPTPQELWCWGLKHIGTPPIFTPEELTRRLQSVAKATVYDNGIWLDGVCFFSENAVVRDLVFKASRNGPFEVWVGYDPDSTNSVELQPDEFRDQPITIPISELSSDYRNLTFEEVAMDLEDAGLLKRKAHKEHEAAIREFQARARRAEDEAFKLLSNKYGSFRGRNMVAKTSDPKTEREAEIQVMQKPKQSQPSRADSPKNATKNAPRISSRDRFASEDAP